MCVFVSVNVCLSGLSPSFFFLCFHTIIVNFICSKVYLQALNKKMGIEPMNPSSHVNEDKRMIYVHDEG
jgi:hypothetical protein